MADRGKLIQSIITLFFFFLNYLNLWELSSENPFHIHSIANSTDNTVLTKHLLLYYTLNFVTILLKAVIFRVRQLMFT